VIPFVSKEPGMFNSKVLEMRGIQYAPPAADKNDIDRDDFPLGKQN